MKKTFYLIILISIIFTNCSTNRIISGKSILPTGEQISDTGKVMPIIEDGKYIKPFPPDENNDIPFSARDKGKKGVTRPSKFLPADKVDMTQAFPNDINNLYVTWLGHSSVLVQIDGIRIFIDPVLSNNASPVFLVNIKRFQKKIPIDVNDLPDLDAVFISHDHYDHLEKDAIKNLAPKTKAFIVPVGVGNHLRKWKIEKEKIREYTWWEEGTLNGISGETLQFACTPGRHRSGRSPANMGKTLWASWVFIGNTHRMFYSGDTSYNFHFKQIGYHYGPFDLNLIECGQYNTAWSESHMFPEETVKAHIELKGKYLIPVHWGSFSLSRHDWWEPPERASAQALRLDVNMQTPRVGQTLQIDENTATEEWWKEFKNN